MIIKKLRHWLAGLFEDRRCMYCEEEGIINRDVFTEVVDVELGPGWVCKQHFFESEIEEKEVYIETLKEIREIVKQANKDICDNCGWHNTDGCSPNGYLCHDLIEIKNKINEVLCDE